MMENKQMKATILTMTRDVEPSFFSFNCYKTTRSETGYYTDYWHRIDSYDMYVSRDWDADKLDTYDEVKTVISINKSVLGVSLNQLIEAKLYLTGMTAGSIKIGNEIYRVDSRTITEIDITSWYSQVGSTCNIEVYPVDNWDVTFRAWRIELTYFADETLTIQDLYIEHDPDKTTYVENTKFDPKGMIVVADYGDGITSVITDYTYDKSPLKYGTKYIDIEYKGFKVEQWISVRSIYDMMDNNVCKSFILDNPKWNIATQDFKFLYSDVSVGDNSYQIAVSHLYDSQNNEAYQQLFSAYGTNWKLDVDVRILRQTDNKGVEQFKMVDIQGNVSRFILFDTQLKRYYNEDDPGTVLILRGEEDSYVELIDERKNRMIFNKAGYLKSTISCTSDSIKKIFEYESRSSDLNNPLRLSKIYDERKPTSYLKFKYDFYGQLQRILVVKDNQTYKGLIYGYADSKLESITQESYHHPSNSAMHTEKIAQFNYVNSSLIVFKNVETKDAIKFTYDSDGHAKRISSGVYTDNKYQFPGLADSYGFIEKKYNKFLNKNKYTSPIYSPSIYQTNFVNERGVKTALQIDSKGNLVSTFEFEEKDTSLLTLEDTVGVHVNINGKDANDLINGEKALRVSSGTFTLPNFNVYKNYTKNYKNYTCSFYVKLQQKQSVRVRAILEYDSQKNYVYIDEAAVCAWQKVTLPIRFKRKSELENVKGVELSFVNENDAYVDVSVVCVYFNGGDADTLYLEDGIKFDDLTEWKLNFVNKSSQTRALNNATGFLTRSDLLRAYTNPLKVSDGCYDIICNDGKMRIANVASATVVTAKKEITFLPSIFYDYPIEFPNIISTGFYNERRAPDNMSWTRQYFKPYSYGGKMHLLMQQEVHTFENGIDGKDSSNDRTSKKSVWLDEFQRALQERDAYGIDTVYTYYPSSGQYCGRLKKVEQVSAPDSTGARTRLTLSENKYTDEGEYLIASTDGISTNSFTHYKPFTTVSSTTETKASEFSGITSSNYENRDLPGIKTKYIYDEYIDYLLSVVASDGESELQNSMTYENGRLRTVTDGMQKFGLRQNLIDDKIEYTVFDGSSEITMQEKKVSAFDSNTQTSTVKETYLNNFDGDKGTLAGYTTLVLDKYGRFQKRSYCDAYDAEEGSAQFQYFEGDASPSSQKIYSVVDDYSNSQITYNYDPITNELVGWDLKDKSTTDNDVSILQIGSGETKYTFGSKNQEKYKTVIEYDTDVTISPRIKSTHIFYDPYNYKPDHWREIDDFSRNYQYDNQGRVKTINSSTDLTDSFEYEDKLNGRAFLVKKYKHERRSLKYSEDLDYDDMGNLKTCNIGWTISGSVWNLPSNESYTYEYDGFNRLCKSIKGGVTTEYRYGDTGRLEQISGGDFARFDYFPSGRDKGRLLYYSTNTKYCFFTYDNYGNRRSIQINGHFNEYPSLTTTFDYERGNLLRRIEFPSGTNASKDVEYGYNYAGMRYVKCLPDGTVIHYLLDGAKIIGENRSDGVELRYFYDASGITGFRYTKDNESENYTYLKDALGNIIGIENVAGRLVGAYRYDERGNHKIIYPPHLTEDREIININPFRWKSFYYDDETGYYNISSRYYDPETATFLNVVTPEEMLAAASSIGGLNRDAITFGNFLAIAANGFDISTMDDLAVDMSFDPDANRHWLELHFNSIFYTASLLFGMLACIFGMEPIGIALIGFGLFGLLSPGAQQVLSGFGIITSGVSAIITGIGLCAAGPVGWVLGAICLIVGVAAIAIGVNEAISGAIGVNYLRQWTGMSETTYYAIYIAITIACTVCTIVGQVYINSKATPSGRKQSGDCRGSECFIAGTLVLTAEGYKKIEDIQVGDLVLAYDEVTGETAYKPVVQLFRNETKEWYHVHVNGEEIVCTGGHPFYVPSLKEFVLAKDLKVGTELLLSNGTRVIIEEIHVEKLKTPETTYNFEVEGFHTYYVSESAVLVHNDCVVKNCVTYEEAEKYFWDTMGEGTEIYGKTSFGGDLYQSADGLRFGYLDTSHHPFRQWTSSPTHFNIHVKNSAGKVIENIHIFWGLT